MATAKKTPAKKTPAKKTTAAKHTAHVSGSQVGDPAEGLVAPAELKPAKSTTSSKKKPSVVGRSTGEKRSTVSRYTTQSRQNAQRVDEAKTMSFDEVVAHALTGKMGTGRDRDDALRQAGHDPVKVSKQMAKLSKESKPEAKKLPIPKNRRGSSWM